MNGTANDTVSVDIVSNSAKPTAFGKVAIVVHHWNAEPGAYHKMAKTLCWAGYETYIFTLPYHGARSVEPTNRVANDFLNADLGVVIRSVRQSVCDLRSLISFLSYNGAKEIHLIGVSLGSPIVALAGAFDSSVSSCSLLLTAGDFAEIVWLGRATRHIRAEFEGHIALGQLQKVWAIISPSNFIDRLLERNVPLLIINGKRDEVVPIRTARRFVDSLLTVEA